MMYALLSFDDFKQGYIDNPEGYLSVWFDFINPKSDSNYHEAEEAQDAKPGRLILRMDMVYPPRLCDRRFRFLEVEISSQVEYQESVNYLRKTQELVRESLDQNFLSAEEARAEIDFT